MSRRRRLWTAAAIGAVAIVVSACKKKPSGPSCEDRVHALDAWMQGLADEGDTVPRGTLAVLDERSRVGIDGDEVVLDAGRVTFGIGSSASTSDPTTLVNELKTWRKNATEIHRTLQEDAAAGGSPVRLSIRPSTRSADVVTLFDALGRVGVQRIGIVFIGNSGVAPPADTELSRWFEQHPHSIEDSSWSKPLSTPGRALMKCPEVVVPIGATRGESFDRSQKTRMLAALPDILRKCNCSVDVEAVKAALWAHYRRYEMVPTLTHTVLLGAKGAPGVVDVHASEGETWERMAPRVAAAAAKHTPIALATSP